MPEPSASPNRADSERRGQIARIKRALEWLRADRGLRQALRQDPVRSAALAAERGLALDFAELEPLWRDGFRAARLSDAERWPLAGLWAEWELEQNRFRQRQRQEADPGPVNPRFSAWRQRQMGRNRFEMGLHDHALTYPVFAYELSQGCSLGCWFCAFEAGPLRGIFRHRPANARLWREVLEVGMETLGTGASQSGFAYWASEPSDNPDYLAFLDDFQTVTGGLGPTTTAAATHDLAWTRDLLARYAATDRPSLRFSVLSLESLAHLHREFSPEELLQVECLTQNPESILPKSRSGRARAQTLRWERQTRELAGELAPNSAGEHPQPEAWAEATSACLAGFLVNLVERSVRLVSPCRVSEAWPRGYRVHAQGTFSNAVQYRAFIQDAIDRQMLLQPPDQAWLRLLPGLRLTREAQALRLVSEHHYLRLTLDDSAMGLVAELAAQGRWTSREVIARVADRGADYFSALAALEALHQHGIFVDDPAEEA